MHIIYMLYIYIYIYIYITYEDWLKLFRIWHMNTELLKKHQGPALVLSLEGHSYLD